MTGYKTNLGRAWKAMVSPDYLRYQHIVRWPDLRMVRRKGPNQIWHFDKPSVSCLKGSRAPFFSGEAGVFKVWITKSLEKNSLYMLNKNGNEVNPDEICSACGGNVMKLLRWSNSEEGRLEIEQQESRDELEEREFRAKGLTE
jgi:hypothetical protein